ncbi:hypothetical protein D3C74_371940 [compost metagenome]
MVAKSTVLSLVLEGTVKNYVRELRTKQSILETVLMGQYLAVEEPGDLLFIVYKISSNVIRYLIEFCMRGKNCNNYSRV